MSRSDRRGQPAPHDPAPRDPAGASPAERQADGPADPDRSRAPDSVVRGAQAGRPAEPGPDSAPDAPPQSGGAAPAVETESVETLRDRWLRAEAELQNFRRRAVREWDEARRGAEERAFLEMIGVMDDLERALDAAREEGAPGRWSDGVRLTVQRMRDYLTRQGVVVLDPVGRVFDPAYHEAMLEMDPPAGVSPGHVIQVVLKGYARGDRVLRPARVVVARAASPGEAGEPARGADASS